MPVEVSVPMGRPCEVPCISDEHDICITHVKSRLLRLLEQRVLQGRGETQAVKHVQSLRKASMCAR
jgi:hypothetical protein